VSRYTRIYFKLIYRNSEGYYQQISKLHLIQTLDTLDDWLTVHHSIIFFLSPTWCTNFLFIYIQYIN